MTKQITNRELLRDYKHWKTRLLGGQIDILIIPQKEGGVLKIFAEKEKTPFEHFLEKVKRKPFKHLKRPKEDII